MGEYYRALQTYGLDVDEPPSHAEVEGWREMRAKEKGNEMLSIAYLGLASTLRVGWERLQQQTERKREKASRKALDEQIDGKRRALESLIPQDLWPLTPIGIIGLGTLKITCSDNNGAAQERLGVVQILCQYDPAAMYLFANYPNAFDGNAAVADELREQHMQQLDPKVLAKVVNGQNGNKQRRRKK